MILYPAIDLQDGRCVRLVRGEAKSATVFNEDPPGQAAHFAAAGCRWLHVVDLDGAFSGRPRNEAAVRAILETLGAGISVQLGGGIRDLSTAAAWLERGVARIVLGTAAVRTPPLVGQVARRFPGQVAVGIDARGGRVAIEGWAEEASITASDLARRVADEGAAAIVYTDIDRDGVKAGVNVEATAALARHCGLPVIASGGVSSLDDLLRLRPVEPDGVTGVIVGRALYDGSIDLAAALDALASC